MLFHKAESAGNRAPGGEPAWAKARRREGLAGGSPGERHPVRGGEGPGEGGGASREGWGLVPGSSWGGRWGGAWVRGGGS